jgi:hypothetical protein
MMPLNERAGYAQIMALAEAAEIRSTAAREKFLQKLTLLAEAEDELFARATRSPEAGCAIRLRNKGLTAIANFVLNAIVAAPDDLVNTQILVLRTFAEMDLKAVELREAQKTAAEQRELDARWEAEAKAKNIRELLAEIESTGILLSLSAEDDDKIVCKGANLDPRHKIWLATRRRDAVLVLRDREHAGRVAEVV